MKALFARHWLPGLLGLCAVVTLALLVWPVEAARPKPTPAAERYPGADHSARNGGPVTGFALRLQPAAAIEAAPAVAEAAPVLVGLAGRRAYLRSAETGQVEGVSVGQMLDGWRLISVGQRTATVRGSSGDRKLELFSTEVAAPASGTTSAPVPAPAGG
ncbi:MAG: hypothetical protein QME55_01055 [Brevundimonas sp.]|uniref:hypothetical protein n=1 Tax=Brevundimonas sp. TaxID=1871086 RepID=UPI00262D8575|nr:hypothetical protein [Brevundimonas sp.]MDI6623292.1 hypothetical protein [Brevundimonas sp.]MDQ7811609.1 hypothetical protein [Brevundimonas sp.]